MYGTYNPGWFSKTRGAYQDITAQVDTNFHFMERSHPRFILYLAGRPLALSPNTLEANQISPKFQMKKWDETPRAVAPSQQMLESTLPILATRQNAENLRNEYGIAVFVISETSAEQAGEDVAEDSGKPNESGGTAGPNDKGVNGVTGKRDGTRQLPMYYVSPQVAKSRGRGLQEEWYVVPEVRKKFCIHATNVSRASSERILR